MRLLHLATGFCLVMFLAGVSYAESKSRYDNIVSQMDALVEHYPDLVESMDIGPNDQGNPIKGVRIEKVDGGVYTFEKPKHLLVGVHHGNERIKRASD